MKCTYFKSDDGQYIYKASLSDTLENVDGKEGYMLWSLELICGREYIHEDYDIQGWCSPEYFVDDMQGEQVIQYFESESLIEAASDAGYYSIDSSELPSHIYQWGEEPSEEDMMW